MRRATAAITMAATAALAACAGGSPGATTLPARPTTSTSAAASPSPSPTPSRPAPTHPATHAAPTTRPVSTPRRAATPSVRAVRPATAPKKSATGSPVDHLVGVGNAQQVIEVAASGYGTSYATLTAYEKRSSGWVRMFGPWSARIGRNGFAPSGQKREGDGRTPTGSYGFSFFFGVNAQPSGIHYSWRHAYTYDVWDDDSSSSRYNLWTDTRTANAGRSPEPMHNQPSYNYAAVIAYNTARTPGMGSAIFFHVSHGSSTAGCVAVSQSQVLAVLRWLNPAKSPRIIMGTTGAITR
jgi:L,D-peptidoglycan transpeptidase YkuD (ErfK/YbiS/YcfS/YnhG family)